MTANTPETMDERAAFEAWWNGKPARNSIGGYIDPVANLAWAAWQAARANLPPPQGDADKVDAERWRYAIKDDGTGRMNWRAVYEAWDGDGYFVDALDAARLTLGGQKP
ncbi:hypothetical protein [Variovorax sp. PAMC 28711]|uniref:hypothetical protein n=1 Tax=Variovorax sp. PAMC 28711 TaxID=1795631 RepID=UPI00078D44BA|nr:hypothetical protein [Variovorax sp. PAMC 28711]AMM23028.1 hypothetical protein AX767_00500 [Variovorax sp. PAMC 28711]